MHAGQRGAHWGIEQCRANAAGSRNRSRANSTGTGVDSSEEDGEVESTMQVTGDGTEEEEEEDNCALALIKNTTFTFIVASAILLNVVSMTFQVDYPAGLGPGCSDPAGGFCLAIWHMLDNIFLAFFTVELVLRLWAHGCKGFFLNSSEEQGWNIFDFFVVGACWLIALFESFSFTGGKFVKLLRSARMLRIMRVLRIFRLPCLKKLQIIIAGLVHSFSVVSWIAAMLGGVMFTCAIVCTDLVGHNADDWGDDAEEIRLFFGSMWNSTVTLFNFLTLADWSYVTRLVSRQEWAMMYFFLAYVIFAAMVILSLLTGVLADHMNTVRENEEREEEAENQKANAQAVKAQMLAFQKATEGAHLLSREQFRSVLDNAPMRERLSSQGVNLGGFDPDDLFECFDSKTSGLISWSEFHEGMEELRTGVKPRVIFKLEVGLRKAVRDSRADLSSDPRTKTKLLEENNKVASRMFEISRQLDDVTSTTDSFLEELKSFQRGTGFPASSGEDGEEDPDS
mmetsp:Transcript_67684/g.195998  ORF Transcript_67684/g.195998 Transcript_67684/m.195998 type:complete len:510 (-) Transcript_67684:68-1597(-)